MIIFTFILTCLIFCLSLGLIIFWAFFNDAEDNFYRCLGCLIAMAIIPALLYIWDGKIIQMPTTNWIIISSSIVAILSVIIYVIRYVFDSINDFDLRLVPFIIPIMISLSVIFYAVAPKLLLSNLNKIISCACVVLGSITAIVSSLSYKKEKKKLRNELIQQEREMHYRYINNSPIVFRNLSKQELLGAEIALAELYMAAKQKKLSTSGALEILQNHEISAELIHKIMERLYSNDFVKLCYILTLTDFIEALLPELYVGKKSYRSYSMDMRYDEDLFQRLRHNINFENKNAIDDLNTKIDSISMYIQKNLKTISSNTNSDEIHGRQNQIRELFHALETPIATSEMALATLNASFDNLSEPQKSKFERIENALKLIKSILFAYRELTFMNIYSDENTFFSLPEIINSIPDVMVKDCSKTKIEQKNIPNNIPKYSTNFIILLLLPLIHNAIEASPDSKTVLVEYSELDKCRKITIENYCKQTPRQANLDTEGYSSKGNNHVGSGISIVRRITKSSGIDFLIKVNNNKVYAELTFPQ